MKPLIDKLNVYNKKFEDFFEGNPSNLGKIYMFIATIFGTIGVFAAKASKCPSLNTILFFRAFITCQLSYRIVQATGVKTIGSVDFIKRIAIRSIIGTTITYLFQKGLMHLPMKEFTTLFNTQPIFTFWLSLYFLNETFHRDKLICTIITILGIALIVNPNYIYLDFSDGVEKDEMFYFSVILVLISAALKGVVIIIVKTINSASPFQNLLYFEAFRMTIGALGYVFYGDAFMPQSSRELLLLALSTLSEYTYHVFSILSLRYVTASLVAIMETLTVLFGFLIDLFYYDEPLYFGSLVGTIMVVGSSFYLTRIKDTN